MQITHTRSVASGTSRGPHPKPLRHVLFGQRAAYEKPLRIGVQPAPLNTIPSAPLPKQTHLFIRPHNQISGLFPKEGPASTLLAELVQKLSKKLKSKPFKDTSGNIYSPFKVKPAETTESKEDNTLLPIVNAFRQALAKVPQEAHRLEVSLPSVEASPADLAKHLAEQAVLQSYNPYLYRSQKPHPFSVKTVTFNNLPDNPTIKAAIAEGTTLGQATNLARHLVDAPPNIKNPRWMSSKAKALATGDGLLQVNIHERSWIKKQKMGLFLSVAAGNQAKDKDQPRLVEMIYTPPDGKYDKTILLVGKGIIFDTGGTNLKSGADTKTGKLYIHGMHGDMAGAAAVIGAMKAIRDMKLPNVRVVALTPLTPNRIGENATLPHSIFMARNGKQVEVSNTDAEGRLVLADAIHYGQETYTPDLIVDIATLTGGKVGALGAQNSVAVMGNNHALSQQVAKLGQALGRKAEAFEITKAHQKWVTKNGKGKADVYNSVGMKQAAKYNVYGPGVEFDRAKHIIHHSIQGGAFLREFLADPKTPWVHLDMAGAEFEPLKHMGGEEYATGFGVKDLYTIVKHVAEGKLPLTPAEIPKKDE